MRFVAGVVLGLVLAGGVVAHAADTRIAPGASGPGRYDAVIRCRGPHTRADAAVFEGFREVGGSMVGFTLTGRQTRLVCR
jgi:hypothetical protein